MNKYVWVIWYVAKLTLYLALVICLIAFVLPLKFVNPEAAVIIINWMHGKIDDLLAEMEESAKRLGIDV